MSHCGDMSESVEAQLARAKDLHQRGFTTVALYELQQRQILRLGNSGITAVRSPLQRPYDGNLKLHVCEDVAKVTFRGIRQCESLHSKTDE